MIFFINCLNASVVWVGGWSWLVGWLAGVYYIPNLSLICVTIDTNLR
jgi:hypothetical protein